MNKLTYPEISVCRVLSQVIATRETERKKIKEEIERTPAGPQGIAKVNELCKKDYDLQVRIRALKDEFWDAHNRQVPS